MQSISFWIQVPGRRRSCFSGYGFDALCSPTRATPLSAPPQVHTCGPWKLTVDKPHTKGKTAQRPSPGIETEKDALAVETSGFTLMLGLVQPVATLPAFSASLPAWVLLHTSVDISWCWCCKYRRCIADHGKSELQATTEKQDGVNHWLILCSSCFPAFRDTLLPESFPTP